MTILTIRAPLAGSVAGDAANMLDQLPKVNTIAVLLAHRYKEQPHGLQAEKSGLVSSHNCKLHAQNSHLLAIKTSVKSIKSNNS